MAAMPKAAIAVSDIRFRLDIVAIQLSFLSVEIRHDGREKSFSFLAKEMSKSLSTGPRPRLLSLSQNEEPIQKLVRSLPMGYRRRGVQGVLMATKQAIHVLLVCFNARLAVRIDTHPSSFNDGGQHHHLEKLPHVEFIDAG